MSDIRCQKDDVGSGMLEYPKGTVKEEERMSDGRVFEGRRKREDGRVFEGRRKREEGRGLRCMMSDVRIQCLMSEFNV